MRHFAHLGASRAQDVKVKVKVKVVPLHLDDIGAIYGWRAVFRNFLDHVVGVASV